MEKTAMNTSSSIEIILKKIENQMEQNKLDFVAIAITHWHAIGVDIEILANSQKRGIVIIAPHPKNGVLITPNDFVCSHLKNIDFYIQDSSSTFKWDKLVRIGRQYRSILLTPFNKGKNRIRFISPMIPYHPFISIFSSRKIAARHSPEFVLVDEGIGTYVSDLVWKKVNKMEGQIGFSRKVKDSLNRKLQGLIEKKTSISKKFLFTYKNDRLHLNESIAKEYRAFFKNEFIPDKKVALIVTQPFSEINLVSLNDEINLLKRAIKRLISNGYHVYLKPHPREENGKYTIFESLFSINNFSIIHQDKSVEKDFGRIKPKVIIGYNSTALITANALYNIRAYSLIKYLVNHVNDIETARMWAEYTLLCESFVRDFSELIEEGERLE
jgi:hypothetical protein